MTSPKTDWVWADSHGGMQGASADLDRKTIIWFEAPGCACGDYQDAQTIADFLVRGSRNLNPPDDVIEDMRAALRQYA